MRICCIGGGPAGLYFSLLMKRHFPRAEITVFEKNQPDDTFGFGVVFSRETLGNLAEADAESYRAIESRFVDWDNIENHVLGERVVSTGHGFCGLSRRDLLQVLHERCRSLGVELVFGQEVSPRELPKADLLLCSDGVHSPLREHFSSVFKPTVDWRKCKFTWLGSTQPLEAFTFIFKQTPHGLFQVHAYPFRRESGAGVLAARSTFIVECRESTWKRAGLDAMSEEQSVAFIESLFAQELNGHRLVANKSIWRTFPTVRCQTWRHQNLVLVGDAAHTAHFSIGSGTKLAMEDALALAQTFQRLGTADVPRALAEYETARMPEVIRFQRAAQTSLEWFENSERYLKQPAWQFTFNLMTRSKRITWNNLRQRDPALVSQVNERFAEQAHSRRNSDASPPPPLFAPFKLRGLELENRVVVSPMCQYLAHDGVPDDWHLTHLGSRAMGGAGLVMTEMTDVSATGRITLGCTGLWNETQQLGWKRIVDFVHARSAAKIGMQLAHAGRKGSCDLPWRSGKPLRAEQGAWQTLAPSALPFDEGWHVPREMTPADFEAVKADFVASAQRGVACGFDLLELHCAHGYLLSSFLSPLSNHRTDVYGGSLDNRLRYPLEIFDAVRSVWPKEKPLGVRISATDWLGPEGLTVEDAVVIARAFKSHGCDFIDVSSAGNSPRSRPEYGRMYQVPFAEAVRFEAEIPVIAVGGIQGADHVNTIIASGRADLCALARPHLSNPSLTAQHAQEEGVDNVAWPNSYALVRPVRPR